MLLFIQHFSLDLSGICPQTAVLTTRVVAVLSVGVAFVDAQLLTRGGSSRGCVGPVLHPKHECTEEQKHCDGNSCTEWHRRFVLMGTAHFLRQGAFFEARRSTLALSVAPQLTFVMHSATRLHDLNPCLPLGLMNANKLSTGKSWSSCKRPTRI